jgi:ABC-2 type transport system ATP-binding protein
MVSLKIENVCKSYGKHTALQDVSLDIPDGTIFGLLGPNGAGKTTLIRIINQIIGADSGKIYLNGESLSKKHIATIGYMPEERGLYKKMKVGEQLLYLSRLKGLSNLEAKRRIIEWLERFEAAEWWDKKVESLSKGMAQKIQFISTIIHKPELLILDEPFSGFDPVNAELIKQEILKLRDEGTTIIFSSHRMESVEEICKHIGLIHHAKVLLQGEINEIKEQFRKREYSALIQNDSEVPPTLSSFNYDLLESKMQVSGRWQVRFKAENGNSMPNSIIQNISKTGQVLSFSEVFPTVHDIFITLVKGKKDAKDLTDYSA